MTDKILQMPDREPPREWTRRCPTENCGTLLHKTNSYDDWTCPNCCWTSTLEGDV